MLLITSARLASCCGGSVSDTSRRARAILGKIRPRSKGSKNFAERVGAITATLDPKTPVEIWFQSLPRRRPGTKCGSARKPAHPALGAARHQTASARRPAHQIGLLFGAICPKRGAGAALVMPRADTQAMQ